MTEQVLGVLAFNDDLAWTGRELQRMLHEGYQAHIEFRTVLEKPSWCVVIDAYPDALHV